MAEETITNAFVKFRLSTVLTNPLTGANEAATLVDYPFAIDPASYVKRDLIDFAPRAGGGDVAYSNLDLYQIVTQDSWHHGFGFVNFRDKFGFRFQDSSAGTVYADNGVDARHIGMAMMWTDQVVDYHSGLYSDSISNFTKSVDFNGSTYFATYNGVWRRTQTGTYSQVLSNYLVNDLISNGQYLIAAIDYTRVKVSRDGTTWSDGGVGSNPPNNYIKLAIHNGYMWGAQTKPVTFSSITGTFVDYGGPLLSELVIGSSYTITASGSTFTSQAKIGDKFKNQTTTFSPIFEIQTVVSNTQLIGRFLYMDYAGTAGLYVQSPDNAYLALHFFAQADASDAEGAGTTDPDAIIVGTGGYTCRGLCSFNGALHIARDDGVWAVDDTVVPPIARRVLDFSDEVDASNFEIFLPWRGRLYFNIKNTLYAYNGASLANVTPPTYSLDFPPASMGNYLAACYRGTWMYVLCKQNGTNVNAVLAFDGTGWFKMAEHEGIGSISYSPLVDSIFFAMYLYPGVTRVPLRNESDLPYARFPTGGECNLSLSEIDFGFRRVKKSFAEVDVEVYNVAAGRYVAVDYSADGGSWYRLGYTQTSGVTQLVMNPTVEANKLDVRLAFRTGDSTQSAVLRNFAIKAMVRPDVLYGHQFTVMGADQIMMLDGMQHTLSSEEQMHILERLRNSKSPIQFVDAYGDEHTAYVSACSFRNPIRRPSEKRSNWQALVNVVEVR